MTSETRILLEMTDILGIEFECRKCKAKILYPLQDHYERLAEKCPNCFEPWFLAPADQSANEVKKIFATLRKVAGSPAVLAQVRLSVKPSDISN